MTEGIMAMTGEASLGRVTDTVLMPTEDSTRAIALELYAEVADAPIISPHSHVEPALLATDSAFRNPAELFITSDHYVTRLLTASGVPLEELGRGTAAGFEPRRAWQHLAEHWHRFAGTATGYWLQREFSTLFGITEELGPDNADEVYQRIDMALRTPRFRPRSLFEEFSIELLATTDDPLDDLAYHREIRDGGYLSGRVLPTFRPDAYLDPDARGFADNVDRLLSGTQQPGTYDGYLSALRQRREYFIAHGAVSADHGVYDPFTTELGDADAARLFDAARTGQLDPVQARLFRGHMLFEMARMSVADGLVMTVHPGVRRNHHGPTFERFGPDTGHDIPVAVEYTENLRPLLNAFGTAPGFHLVLFTIDETVFSREVAPLAGFYPAVYAGAPWWFLDAPDAVLRYRSAVTETAGFYRTSGFIDDTRAFLSIPARHDMARRLDSGYLARLVAQGRISMTTARRIAHDLVKTIPREVFKL